jgi:DNA-binding MarR family transcriptional regulator
MHYAEADAVADELNDELMHFVRLMKSAAQTEVGMDRSLLLLLSPLLHEGPMRLRDLAEAKGSDASTVSRQAAQLVRAGLLRRDPDPMDRRACLVTLTEGGRDFCQRLMAARRQAIADALREWNPDRVRAFTEMFREFNRAVEAHQALPPSAMPGSRSTASPPAGAANTKALAARG